MGDRELIADLLAEAASFRAASVKVEGDSRAADLLERAAEALADPEREGWVLVPRKATTAMMERTAFNLCAEYGVEFVQPLGQFVEDAYAELLSAVPKPEAAG